MAENCTKIQLVDFKSQESFHASVFSTQLRPLGGAFQLVVLELSPVFSAPKLGKVEFLFMIGHKK